MIIFIGFSVLAALVAFLFFVFSCIARHTLCSKGDLGYSAVMSRRDTEAFITDRPSDYMLTVRKSDVYITQKLGSNETPLFHFPTTKKRFTHYFEMYRKDFRA